jgi:hypothetical protein
MNRLLPCFGIGAGDAADAVLWGSVGGEEIGAPLSLRINVFSIQGLKVDRNDA